MPSIWKRNRSKREEKKRRKKDHDDDRQSRHVDDEPEDEDHKKRERRKLKKKHKESRSSRYSCEDDSEKVNSTESYSEGENEDTHLRKNSKNNSSQPSSRPHDISFDRNRRYGSKKRRREEDLEGRMKEDERKTDSLFVRCQESRRSTSPLNESETQPRRLVQLKDAADVGNDSTNNDESAENGADNDTVAAFVLSQIKIPKQEGGEREQDRNLQVGASKTAAFVDDADSIHSSKIGGLRKLAPGEEELEANQISSADSSQDSLSASEGAKETSCDKTAIEAAL